MLQEHAYSHTNSARILYTHTHTHTHSHQSQYSSQNGIYKRLSPSPYFFYAAVAYFVSYAVKYD